MSTAIQQIQSANTVIVQNIETLSDRRSLLSQNILAQLRNLVEGVAVLIHVGLPDAEFTFPKVEPALSFIRSKAKFNFIGKFHKLIQASASHYTLDGDASERLMLKYYEYLHRLRGLLRDYKFAALANLEKFPVDLDPSLREYHEKIVDRIAAHRATAAPRGQNNRYYIHKIAPFFVKGLIYYEVTFYPVTSRNGKIDRIIGFTDLEMTDKYAVSLTLESDSIQVAILTTMMMH